MNFHPFPLQKISEDLIQRLTANFQLLENLLNGHVDALNIDGSSIVTGLIADGAVTAAKLSTDAKQAPLVTGTYVGDGTAGLEINLGFRPRYLKILKSDDSTIFEAWGGLGGSLASGWRVAAGTWNTGATNFQGCSTNGILTGSAAANLSNKAGVTYAYAAWR